MKTSRALAQVDGLTWAGAVWVILHFGLGLSFPWYVWLAIGWIVVDVGTFFNVPTHED